MPIWPESLGLLGEIRIPTFQLPATKVSEETYSAHKNTRQPDLKGGSIFWFSNNGQPESLQECLEIPYRYLQNTNGRAFQQQKSFPLDPRLWSLSGKSKAMIQIRLLLLIRTSASLACQFSTT